jgi:hypothetical protein
MVDIYEQIKAGVYEPDMNYPKKPKKPIASILTAVQAREYGVKLEEYEKLMFVFEKEMKEYRKQKNIKFISFKRDALEYCGIPRDHLKAVLAFSMAWDRGHSSGLHDVIQELEELSNLITLEPFKYKF